LKNPEEDFMKKNFAILLSLLMVFSLGACAAENGQTLPNPAEDATAEVILETLGITFNLPEGVSDASYSIITVDDDQEHRMAQVEFTLNGQEICYRIQPAEELSDNTGMYFEWENTEENATVGTCPAILSWNEDAEGICCWYDETTGLLYSVSVTSGASAGSLTKLAEMLYLPIQEAVSEPDFTVSGLQAELIPWTDVVASCMEETFGADADFTQGYTRLYATEEDANAGTNCAALVPEGEIAGTEATYDGQYIDPAYAVLYPVSNYTTAAEVEAHLREYLSDTAYETLVGEYLGWDFFEFEGTLYLVRGGRGYGAEYYDWTTVSFLGEQDGLAAVSVDKRMFDELSGTDTFFFGFDTDGLYKVMKVETASGTDETSEETSGAKETVKTITDRTLTEDLVCAQALEKIDEDDAYTYYLPCLKSQYIVVAYESGKEENALEALENGNIPVDDLIAAGITVIKEAK
jgi:hypothetical protein